WCVLNQQSQQPQPAQFNQPVNTNVGASSEGKDMEPNGNPSSDIYVDFEVNKNGMIVKLEGMKHIQLKNQTRCLKSIPGPVMIENDQQLQQSVEDINKAKINLTQWSKILNIHRHESSLDN
ncbi:3339_t:CDS:2, partial [Rhizophagus irregularis]